MDASTDIRRDTWRAPRTKWLFFFSFLGVFGIVDSFHDFIARRGEGIPVDFFEELQGGIFYWLPCIALVPAVIFLSRRFPLSYKHPGSIAVNVLGGLVFTYVNVMIQAIPARHLDGPMLGYWGRFFALLKFEFALDYTFYCLIVVCVYLLRQYEDIKEREVRASQLELALGQTRLRAIQAQLNPHFFFNTLQAISVMALAGERDGVVQTLNRLSSLLRVSFDQSRPQHVPLAEELDFLAGYLEIQQLCFGQRLLIERAVAAEVLDAYVPTMILQPLVENALVHGIAVKPGKGTIRISATKSGDDLLLEVADSGPGFETRQPYRSGVGLSATESRLSLLFGDSHTVRFERSDLGGASVVVRMPFLAGAPPPLVSEGAV